MKDKAAKQPEIARGRGDHLQEWCSEGLRRFWTHELAKEIAAQRVRVDPRLNFAETVRREFDRLTEVVR